MMHRNKSVDVHQFAMIPKADIPRSSFKIESTHKTSFDAGFLVPVYVDEVLPGDTFRLSMTAFARLATPLFPIMDNMYLDSFFFFVPNRLIWSNWQKFMGAQDNPDDSTSFIVPVCPTPVGGYAIGSLQDYMGLPTVGQLGAGATVNHAAFHTRAYNLIYNEWFRDENLQDSVVVDKDDGPDNAADYVLLRRGKRHDYITSSLPWPQKGESVSIPLGTSADVKLMSTLGVNQGIRNAVTHDPFTSSGLGSDAGANLVDLAGPVGVVLDPAGTLYADLSAATAATINQLRQSFQIQKLLERDARGGTRYTEIVRAHFGVVSPDARLQRPEYLGGGSVPVNIHPIAQTSGTGAYTPTPQGNLAAMGTVLQQGTGFSQSFTEHGVIIGLVSVRADLTYQQGMRRMWNRSTRYDFYFPAFAMLGEQTVYNREIYCDGSVTDGQAWGYQERWAEYRYQPAMITSLMRSTAAGTLDAWHLAQRFVGLPTLSGGFIEDKPPIDRIVAVGAGADGQQFLLDAFFRLNAVRPLPMYSVPGLIDHF
ncbi:MAG: major capsid protein [Microviridae sp.]|nr:MAG: major capsid protein [Microviridae sp.]